MSVCVSFSSTAWFNACFTTSIFQAKRFYFFFSLSQNKWNKKNYRRHSKEKWDCANILYAIELGKWEKKRQNENCDESGKTKMGKTSINCWTQVGKIVTKGDTKINSTFFHTFIFSLPLLLSSRAIILTLLPTLGLVLSFPSVVR